MVAKTPEESRIAGDFGEQALAFFLAKKGIHVMRADTVFFDLIAKDPSGNLFKEDSIVGISVKFRDRCSTTSSCTIVHDDFASVAKYGEKWNIAPYFCHIILSERTGVRKMEGFIFSLEDAKKYFAQGKRQYAVSFSKLRGDASFVKGENRFEWLL